MIKLSPILTGIVIAITAILSTPISIILDGLERKLKATIQSRIGPPITQTLYDLLKLTIKEVKPVHTIPYVFLYYVSFLATMIGSIYLALYYAYTGDLVALASSIALLSISLTAFTMIPLLIPNPFSYIGGMREVILAIVNESSIVIGFTIYLAIVNAVYTKPLPLVIRVFALALIYATLLLASYSLSGRPPFDIAEAEPELASGIMIELSGPLLALYILFNLLRRYSSKLLVSVLLISLLLGHGLIPMLFSMILTILLWIVYSVIGAVMGRSRVDVAPVSLGKVYILLYSLSITVLLVILYV